ncbi:MAG: hypothetical protein B5M53_00525 [Candidatus Cloacimonas sp. 4484_209]|nr:MAG: hypothetical protein B5M53_00525 [Candidatus Cloacimonas sp. 4484_209]
MELNKKFKIIHIITQFALGGATENTLITVSKLRRKKFSPLVVSGKEPYKEGDLLDYVKSIDVPFFINKNLKRSINPIRDLFCLFSLSKFIRIQKGTIVHTHSSKAGIIGRWAGYLAGCRLLIHTVHGWSFHQYMVWWKRYLFVFLERFTARFTSKLICVTNQDVKKGLQNRIGTKEQYMVIRSGFDIQKFDRHFCNIELVKRRFNLPLNKKIVGSVGRLSYQKDPKTFVRSAYIVTQERDDVIFVYVGDGKLRDEIERMIENLGLKKSVYLLGFQKDIEKIFPIFDIFILTSLWEGLPKVIPQAMASEVPVVATSVDGVREIIQHDINGLLSPPGDFKSLAKNVLVLLNDNVIRKRFVQNSLKKVKEFDEKLMVKTISELYEKEINRYYKGYIN